MYLIHGNCPDGQVYESSAAILPVDLSGPVICLTCDSPLSESVVASGDQEICILSVI